MLDGMHHDKKKVLEIYRQIMNVLERRDASTEEGFIVLVTALKTIVENDALPLGARNALKEKVKDAMDAYRVQGEPALLIPGRN